MREQLILRSILWPLGLGVLFAASQAQAQEAFPAPHQLTVKMEDENGVDALSGNIHFRIPDASIGDLAHITTILAYDSSTQPDPSGSLSPPEHDNFIGGLGYVDARDYSHFNFTAWYPRPFYQMKVGGVSGTFYINQDHSLQSFDGNTLSGTGIASWVTTSSNARDHPVVLDSSQGIWTFTSRDGTQVEIDTSKRPTIVQFAHYLGVATKISYPSGQIVRINYRSDCTGSPRVQSVTRNDGLMLKYTYADSSCTALQTGVIAINTAFEYCDPFADTCAVDPKWRRSQYGYTWANDRSVYNVTDQRGVLSRFTKDKWARVLAYKPPGNSEDLMTFRYCQSYWTNIGAGPSNADTDEVICGETDTANGTAPPVFSAIYNRIISVTRGGAGWGYSPPRKLAPGDSSYFRQYTISRPTGLPTYVNVDTRPGGGLTDYINPSQAVVAFSDPETQLVTHGQLRGQPYETFTYDTRGNVLSNGITSANYDAACANMVKCNKPIWVRDVAGNQADYTYDSVHGGVLTETLPAGANGVRPQKRYTYAQRYAWYLNPSSVLTRSTEPVWVLASESYCRTGAAAGAGCAIAGDEVVTTYDYGPDSGPSNLWLRGTVVTADGQSLRSCIAYNKFGDKISQTTPRAGLAVCP